MASEPRQFEYSGLIYGVSGDEYAQLVPAREQIILDQTAIMYWSRRFQPEFAKMFSGKNNDKIQAKIKEYVLSKYSFRHNYKRDAVGIFMHGNLMIDNTYDTKDLKEDEKFAITGIRGDLELRLDRMRIVKESWK